MVDIEAKGGKEQFLHDCKENEPDLILLPCREEETLETLKERMDEIKKAAKGASFGIVTQRSA